MALVGAALTTTAALLAACGSSTTDRQAAGVEEPSSAPEAAAVETAVERPEEEVLAAAVVGPCTDPATWMACMFPKGNVALTEMTMPGSHDAATYGIDSGQDYARNCGSVPKAIPAAISGKWARTQDADLGKQAANGSRYFDIRVYFTADGSLSTCHSLEGATFADAFGANSRFQKFVRSHPAEVFILDLQQFFAENGATDSPNRKKQLAAWFEDNLGDLIFARPSKGATLSEVDIAIMRSQGRNVVVLAADEMASSLNYWPRSANLYSQWADVTKPAITFWKTKMVEGQEQWPIDLAARELRVLDEAPASGKLNVLNYILDTNCPTEEVGDVPCYSAYVGWAGTVSNTAQWLVPRIPSMTRQMAKRDKHAILMRDISSTGSNAPIWNLNTQEMS